MTLIPEVDHTCMMAVLLITNNNIINVIFMYLVYAFTALLLLCCITPTAAIRHAESPPVGDRAMRCA